MRKVFLLLLGAVAGAALTLLATEPGVIDGASATTPTGAQRRLQLFGEVFERVRADYVERPDDSWLIEAAINGMLGRLDPHSGYMDPSSLRELRVHLRGEFGGVGVEVIMEEAHVKVVGAMDGTPAARAGIMADDIITHIDEAPLRGLTLDQAVDRMRGPVGGPIRLKIMRKGENEPIDLTIVREIIHVQSVSHRREGDDIGYVRISQFDEQTADRLKAAIVDLSTSIPAGKLKGYVVDLRNNPGGLLDQAILVSSAFLRRGEVVSTRGRNTEQMRRFHVAARFGDLTRGKPLMVLINGGSASASEIVAGALQDHRRATIIGTRSFGKGSVQAIIPLEAENAALRLTVARYFTPAGRSIQAKGIVPDIEVMQDVPDEAKSRPQIAGEAALRGHLRAQGDEQAGSQSYVPPDAREDKALNLAFALLRMSRSGAASPLPRN